MNNVYALAKTSNNLCNSDMKSISDVFFSYMKITWHSKTAKNGHNKIYGIQIKSLK